MMSFHIKVTKFERKPLCNLRALCGSFLLFAASALAQEATQKPRIICEHAAPPPGMRWVCKSSGSCDCHLEGKMKTGDDGPVSVPSETPKICSYNAPKKGDLLVCDPECQCKPEKDPESSQPQNLCQRPITVMVPPVYPPIAWTNALSGVVFVQAEVNDDGTVKQASVVDGHPLLRPAAVDAVSNWRFDPACNRVQIVTLRFRITQDEKNDPAGYRLHLPDEIEIVKKAPEVNPSTAKIAKKKKSKKTATESSK